MRITVLILYYWAIKSWVPEYWLHNLTNWWIDVELFEVKYTVLIPVYEDDFHSGKSPEEKFQTIPPFSR